MQGDRTQPRAGLELALFHSTKHRWGVGGPRRPSVKWGHCLPPSLALCSLPHRTLRSLGRLYVMPRVRLQTFIITEQSGPPRDGMG